jgi:hypothetical protein
MITSANMALVARADVTWIGVEASSRMKSNGNIGTVHSVYRGALNVMTDQGMITFVADGHERGPLNVNYDQSDLNLSSLSLSPGDCVRRYSTTIKVGECLLLLLENAKVYEPEARFSLPVRDPQIVRRNIQCARSAALKFGHLAGLGDLLESLEEGIWRHSGKGLNTFSKIALPQIKMLLEAVRGTDLSAIGKATLGLAGLGPGLTPSGDDLLSGFMLMISLYAKNTGRIQERVTRINGAVLSAALGRTTTVSEEYLIQASQGRGNESATILCRELLTGEEGSIEQAVRNITIIGETSGTDTTLGIILGAGSFLELEECE